MSEELKSLLTLIGLIFTSVGLSVVVFFWFLARNSQDDYE